MPALFRILVVAATDTEGNIVRKLPGITETPEGFKSGNCVLEILVTGVGSAATAWTLTKWLSSNQYPDLAINVGIAGGYREDLKIGDVVIPVSDCFADAGIETGSGFLTLSEAGLQEEGKFPFRKGLLVSENKYVTEAVKYFKPVRAITVNTATGTAATIGKMVRKYDPDIETMEGATFFYICIRENVPFVAFRSISNRVEPRDRSGWNINLALENLSAGLGVFIHKIT